MKILITNVWLNQFSGSELVTLELYEFFVRNGHDVEIFTNVISPKMQEFLQKKNIFVATPSTFDIRDEYDLVWVHHQNIPSVFFDKNPLVGSWIFHHMSPFEPLEFTLNASFENSLSKIVLANSHETLEKLGSLGIDLSKVEIFSNPAPESFFEYPDAKKSDSYFLFVSNHPPQEILQAMEILEEMGQPFIHLGSGSRWAVSRRVTADDLAGAKVVVSIGKSLQYSIAMQKCFFVYDHFGGDGFVSSKSNFGENSKFNFSGRNSRTIKSAQQIVSELLQFESQNPYALGYVTKEDRLSFNLRTKIEGLLSRLDFSIKLPFLAHVEPKSLEVFRGSLNSIRRLIVNEFNTSANYGSAVAERDSAVAERDSAVAERDSAVAERDSVLNSTIWKLFKPYRKLRKIFLS